MSSVTRLLHAPRDAARTFAGSRPAHSSSCNPSSASSYCRSTSRIISIVTASTSSSCSSSCSNSSLTAHGGARRATAAATIPRASSKRTQPQQQPQAAEVEEIDAFVDFDDQIDEDEEEDGWYVDEDEDEESWQDGAGAGDWDSDLDPSPGASTGGVSWGETALDIANTILEAPTMADVQLYAFRVVPAMRKIDVRLDNLTDPYGSPSIDELEFFARQLRAGLEASLGAEASDDIALEVSSPGAERQLVLPGDLQRFGELPLFVEWREGGEDGSEGAAQSKVLELLKFDEAAASTQWRLADVRANAPTKGRGLSKRQRQQQINIPLASLRKVHIHVEL